MLKIRRSRDRLIFNMGIPMPGKDNLYIETGPWTMLAGKYINYVVLSQLFLATHHQSNWTFGFSHICRKNYWIYEMLNTGRPTQNGQHFADSILNLFSWVLFTLKCVLKCSINFKSDRPSHYLNKCWPIWLMPYASLGHNELTHKTA